MDEAMRRRVEVEVLYSVLDDLDYYKLFKLKPGAPLQEVERAFAEQSKAFHPDSFFGVADPEFQQQVTRLFKKVSEAYQVLKAPDLKKLYDKKLGLSVRGGGSELSAGEKMGSVNKAALEAEKAAMNSETACQDKRSQKYWELSDIAWANEDWNGVVMNIQFAMNYEPNNKRLKEKLAQAKKKLDDKKKKELNPYKIKIV